METVIKEYLKRVEKNINIISNVTAETFVAINGFEKAYINVYFASESFLASDEYSKLLALLDDNMFIFNGKGTLCIQYMRSVEGILRELRRSDGLKQLIES